MAQIAQACAPLLIGDYLTPYEPVPVPLLPIQPASTRMTPETGGMRGEIVVSLEDQVTLGQGYLVSINLGKKDGVVPENLFTIFRYIYPSASSKVLGAFATLTVQRRSATARIMGSWASSTSVTSSSSRKFRERAALANECGALPSISHVNQRRSARKQHVSRHERTEKLGFVPRPFSQRQTHPDRFPRAERLKSGIDERRQACATTRAKLENIDPARPPRAEQHATLSSQGPLSSRTNVNLRSVAQERAEAALALMV
jgi:hypothetical protein